ncbi:hypothetical protein R5R35_003258 [Gryllus longicercus]|uniref:Uncharacterized protein n=1 Tax=Gryllus longicercus TaxID=2509291 RepID=A0AAN9VZS0_9ORTH
MGARSAVAGALLLVAATTAAAAAPNQLPHSWPRCRRRDHNLDVCLQHAIQVAIPQLAAGAPEFDIPPLEPLVVNDSITINRRPGRLSLQLKMSNLYSHGLSAAKVLSVFSDLDNGVIDMHLTLPISVMSAESEVEGTILHEPVRRQNGTVNITFYDLSGILVVSGRIVERDGDSYLDVNYSRGSILSLGGLDIHFEPLDRNPQRSAKLNYLLNNNALALWPDMREALENTHADKFVNIANSIFKKVPLKEIFLSDDHPAVVAGPTSVLLFGR